jgi:EAL domain-containing protein (putative c-di-GMP-specific phosphodiesterase class I)
VRSRLIERLVAPDGIRAVFQPIFDLRQEPFRIVAVEGLSRGPQDTNLSSPDVLFEYARRKRQESVVDRAAVCAILRAAGSLIPDWNVHLNVHATTIVRDVEFADFLTRTSSERGISRSRLVVELLEHWAADVEPTRLLEGLERLRSAGLRVALDDVGAGVSNLGLILMTSPSLLKVDSSLVQGVATSPPRSAAVRAVRVLAREIGAEIVVEGIETREDLAKLRELEIPLGQGFLLARPASALELRTAFERSPVTPPNRE